MNIEEAYEVIAKSTIAEAGTFAWSMLSVEIKVFNKMCKARYWLYKDEEKMQADGSVSLQESRNVSNAVFTLRKNILGTTGQRIWGLTFNLFPTGKFNIEYDYNKPEGYEETDEVISGDEINSSLNKIVP